MTATEKLRQGIIHAHKILELGAEPTIKINDFEIEELQRVINNVNISSYIFPIKMYLSDDNDCIDDYPYYFTRFNWNGIEIRLETKEISK